MVVLMSTYKRKIQKIGKNTFIVTLPSSWAREVGLEPRCEVVLEVLPDRSLRIYRASSIASRELSAELRVDINYNDHDIAREIIALYIAGVSVIKIVYENINRVVVDKGIDVARDRLIGLEVVDEDTNLIVLQIVVDPNLRDIESVIKRLKRVTISMHRDIVRYILENQDITILDAVMARDNLADKLYLLALRQLTQILQDPHELSKRGIDYVEAIHRVMFIKSLERIADHAVNMAKVAKDASSIPKDLVELYKDTIDLFDEMAEAFINMDKRKAVDLVKHVEKLRILDEEVRKKIGIDNQFNYSLSRFIDIVSRILARTIDAEETIIDINALRMIRNTTVQR